MTFTDTWLTSVDPFPNVLRLIIHSVLKRYLFCVCVTAGLDCYTAVVHYQVH
jgi:hypothetical protein